MSRLQEARGKTPIPFHGTTAARPYYTRLPVYSHGRGLFWPSTCQNWATRRKKMGVIYTCLSTRAVHLDKAYSMTQDSFINSERRFVAVRGRPAEKWLAHRRDLQPNDIVLVVEPNTPRGIWPIGRVIESLPGPDGIVRVVRVRTKTGIFVRPVGKLCLLVEAKKPKEDAATSSS